MNIVWMTGKVAGASLLLGAASLMAGNLLMLANQPADGTFAATFDVVAGHPGMWLLASILAIAGPILWLPGVLASPAAAPGRGRSLTIAGSLLLALGLAVGVGHFALFFGVLGAAADGGLSADSTQALVMAEDGYILGTVLLVVFLSGLVLGTLLLAFGLRMARAVPVWVPVAAVVFAVTNFLGGTAATLVGAAAIAAVFVPAALALMAPERSVSRAVDAVR